MAHRLVAQVLFTGAQVFGKAFVHAYKQAAATGATGAVSKTVQGGISLDEACRILNVRSNKLDPQQVKANYEHLFSVNSREKGSTLYLQSKIFRAKERLDAEFKTAGPSSGPGPGQPA
ncbi:Pam16-domain-containing protein [Dipodascopsis tothii]|uniref:Pam16-domain-containing protein n=1 Tax=Dipodascopsis tothii TaxID=44089 RepID=UPI0034CD4CCA